MILQVLGGGSWQSSHTIPIIASNDLSGIPIIFYSQFFGGYFNQFATWKKNAIWMTLYKFMFNIVIGGIQPDLKKDNSLGS